MSRQESIRSGLHIPAVLRFFELNPAFDLLRSDLVDPSAVASLTWSDIAAEEVLP
ncbi:hypothetical protein J2785_001324 [Burkholderia ambifaria]|nr:hypothetical protein [Burkholderia ambifaria]MDR6498180.1 hypothetical protein [Burkholderia ambifaria]